MTRKLERRLCLVCMLAIVIPLTLVFVLSGCVADSPETTKKQQAAKAAEQAAEEANKRFEIVNKQQRIGHQWVFVVKDKETDIEYVMVTYGESVVFRPLLKKEER